MQNFFNTIKENVTFEMMLYGGGALIAILVLTIVLVSLKKKKTKKEIEILEHKYTALKTIPLSFKLNKANQLAKVNNTIEEFVSTLQIEFDDVSLKLKECSVCLQEADDYVYSNKVKKANKSIASLMPILHECESLVSTLDAKLDQVLEQENMQRENINALKSVFRELKKTYISSKKSYRQSVDTIDALLIDIEGMFTVFEEWMYASEFDKAQDKNEEIADTLKRLDTILNEIPTRYEKSCVIIPMLLEEVVLFYQSLDQRNIYTMHLDVQTKFDAIQDQINEVNVSLSDCRFDGVDETLMNCEQVLKTLQAGLQKEEACYDVVNTRGNELFQRIKQLNMDTQKIIETYVRVNEKFGFEQLQSQISTLSDSVDDLNTMHIKLSDTLEVLEVPFTTIVVSFEELDSKTVQNELLAKDIHEKLMNATSDEERAKKQLVKLQLIVNEMRVKIVQFKLPSVDEKYEDDLRSANIYIIDIKELLQSVPLDVERLNAKLQDAIDYIYTLYNTVNNLVNMASMSESAIVFGNRYRNDYVEIDAELTRAELCFTNGQYTKALKIAITAIEKIHPGVYESLLENGKEA